MQTLVAFGILATPMIERALLLLSGDDPDLDPDPAKRWRAFEVEAIINSPSVDTSSAAVTVFVLVLVYVSASLDLILNFIPVTPELELTILILFPILTVTLSSPLSSLSLSLSPAMHTERTSSSSQLPALIFLPTFGLLLLLLLLCNDEEGVACPLKEKKRELCQYYTSFLEKMRTYVWYPLSFSDDIQLRIQDESTIVA